MRSYLELDMYTSLTVHTESTLAAGRAELLVFEGLLHVTTSLHFCMYMPYSDIHWVQDYEPMNPDKSWNFPKAHTHSHVFDDIKNKGVTRNYNTKPDEKAHRSLKAFYLFHTNFKDIAPQVFKFIHLWSSHFNLALIMVVFHRYWDAMRQILSIWSSAQRLTNLIPKQFHKSMISSRRLW